MRIDNEMLRLGIYQGFKDSDNEKSGSLLTDALMGAGVGGLGGYAYDALQEPEVDELGNKKDNTMRRILTGAGIGGVGLPAVKGIGALLQGDPAPTGNALVDEYAARLFKHVQNQRKDGVDDSYFNHDKWTGATAGGSLGSAGTAALLYGPAKAKLKAEGAKAMFDALVSNKAITSTGISRVPVGLMATPKTTKLRVGGGIAAPIVGALMGYLSGKSKD